VGPLSPRGGPRLNHGGQLYRRRRSAEHEMPARDSASLVSSAARGVADGNLLGSAHELVIVDTLNTLTCTDAAIS